MSPSLLVAGNMAGIAEARFASAGATDPAAERTGCTDMGPPPGDGGPDDTGPVLGRGTDDGAPDAVRPIPPPSDGAGTDPIPMMVDLRCAPARAGIPCRVGVSG